jgi:hypothetical protein
MMGNMHDALFMAARAALWDTRMQRTRAVEYRPDTEEGGKGGNEMDVDSEPQSDIDTRRSKAPVAGLEPEHSWDDGAVLGAGSLTMLVDLGDSVFTIVAKCKCRFKKKTSMSKGESPKLFESCDPSRMIAHCWY